jgi:hypothetical protein
MSANSLTARNIRTYLAGTGASGALVAAAVVAFLTVGALFAFDGMPGDPAPSEGGSVFVGQGAPAAAATAVAGAPGAVAAAPAPLPPAAADALLAAAGPDGGLPPGAPAGPGAPTTEGGTTLVPTAEPGDAPPAPTSTSQGPVGGLVEGVGQATGDPGLGQATKPITDPVDQALDQTGVGDTVDQAVGGVNDTLGGALGGGQ